MWFACLFSIAFLSNFLSKSTFKRLFFGPFENNFLLSNFFEQLFWVILLFKVLFWVNVLFWVIFWGLFWVNLLFWGLFWVTLFELDALLGTFTFLSTFKSPFFCRLLFWVLLKVLFFYLFRLKTFMGVSTAFEFTVLIFPVDCNQKSRWEDGTCITSCPFCGPILSPKAGFGEAREEKETSPEEKQESACPSGKIIRSV